MDVEMVFRDIDANGIVLHLFRASACHSGLSPGIRSGQRKRRGPIQLSHDPSNGPRVPDPTLATVERAATLSQRSLLASAARKVIRQAGISRTSSRPDG